MPSSQVWLPTLLQPVAVLLIVLLGVAGLERYPTGETAETALLVALGLVTVPGLVVAVADAVERSRRARPGERPGYQRALDTIVPRGDTPVMPQSTAVDVVMRVLVWGTLQALLVALLGLGLLVLPVDDGWAGLVMLLAVLVAALVLLVLVGTIFWTGVSMLSRAVRPRTPSRDGAPEASDEVGERPRWLPRALLAAVGVLLLGLAGFGLPYAVLTWGDGITTPWRTLRPLESFADHDAVGWVWALRVSLAAMGSGLAAAVVLSLVAVQRGAWPSHRNRPGGR